MWSSVTLALVFLMGKSKKNSTYVALLGNNFEICTSLQISGVFSPSSYCIIQFQAS